MKNLKKKETVHTGKILSDKVAIVTGSTRGNGRAIAELFSAQGSNVVVVGRNEAEAKSAAEDLKKKYKTHPLGVRADVVSDDDVAALVRTTLREYGGRIDILVNNAGYPIKDELWDKPFHKMREEDLNAVMEVDAVGTVRCILEVLPIMMKQKPSGGVIINISSTPAISGYDKGAPYTIAKSAVLGITRHIAKEYGKYGVRCNTIAPGSIATEMNWGRLSEAQRKDLVSGIPLGRPGKPEDVAGVALMLSSDYCQFINGQKIVVDGGEVTI
jgi:3-oxoacyl-[acyl-carrier protein] reductase